MKLSKDQLFKMLDGIAASREIAQREGRQTRVNEAAKEAGIHFTTAYMIARGGVPIYRPWVEEWRALANGLAEKMPPLLHIRGTPVDPAVAAYARELAAKGAGYGTIERKTGIPQGSLSAIIHGAYKGPKRKTETKIREIVATDDAPPPKKKTTKVVTAKPAKREPKLSDLGEDFRKFIEAKEEQALTEMRVRHDAEREELAERHREESQALVKTLADKRQSAIHRLVDFYTDPKNPDAG